MATSLDVSGGDTRITRQRPRGAGGTARRDGEGLANALGWFSIGLGLAQIVAPRGVARLVGADPDEETTRLMRAIGVREISSGIGILSNRRPEAWVRARVAGDVMDLAMLGRTLMSDDADRGKTVAATVAVLGVTALDILATEKLSQANESDDSAALQQGKPTASEKGLKHVRRSITIGRPLEEVSAFWAEHGGDEAVEDETVFFVPAPGGRGTEVHLHRTYRSPGRISAVLATFRFDNPDQRTFNELHALKQAIETGDVVISDAWLSKGPHPAQPEP